MLQKIKVVRRGRQNFSKFYLVEKMALIGRKERVREKNHSNDPTIFMKTKGKSRDKRDDPTMLMKISEI